MTATAPLSQPRLSEGDRAPDFELQGTGGRVRLSALAGQKIVLYFYPKDDTPGCTTETLDFTRLKDRFTEIGTTVYGISKDSIKSHEKFCGKYAISIPLLSDDGAMCESYGVWAEKSMYGKKYMGIERTTFLIDGEGIIARIWPKVKVDGHAQEVLDATAAL